MVGARVRDGGGEFAWDTVADFEGPISDVQLACRTHAQRIGILA